MRPGTIVAALAVALAGCGGDDEAGRRKAGWLDDYQTARAKAGRENRPLLLYFTGSDW